MMQLQLLPPAQAFTLHKRAADFLAAFPPFSMMERHDVLSLCRHLQARYYEPQSAVYTEGSLPMQELYVVRHGVIHLEKTAPDALNNSSSAPSTVLPTVLMDVREEGDVFGISSQISGKPHIATARVHEEALLYVIPWKDFFPMLERYPNVALFLASNLASSVQMIHMASMAHHTPTEPAQNATQNASGTFDTKRSVIPFGEADVLTLSAARSLISASTTDAIQSVAELMTVHGIGSVIITDEKRLPVGIITDTDLRKKVATGRHRITEPASSIMNTPVITAKEGLSAAQALMMMMRHNIRHICLTDDGTPASAARGIISQHDILLRHGNNPALLVKEILQSRSIDELPNLRNRAEELAAEYLRQEVSVNVIGEILSYINDALTTRALREAEARLEAEGWIKPPAEYCWIVFGSDGRREQLLRTDQDNAIIYTDTTTHDISASPTHAYFVALAKQVNQTLVKCGFAPCPGNMMASNPAWCKPLHTWKHMFEQWICQAEPAMLLNATIFFDFRPVTGATFLAAALRETITAAIAQEQVFLRFMAHHALEHPPLLSFFRNVVVEKSGEHKDTFDIKTRALAPLADAARVLSLEFGCHEITNTIGRFERIAALHPIYKQLCSNAATAYQILLRFRVINGLRTGTSGQFLRPSDANRIERQIIRTTFDAIEELQKVLRVRYRLDSM